MHRKHLRSPGGDLLRPNISIMSLQGSGDRVEHLQHDGAALFSPSRSKSLLGRKQFVHKPLPAPLPAGQSSGRVVPPQLAAKPSASLFSSRVELIAHIGFCMTGVISSLLIDWCV
jgi:hypothetical protein